MSISANSSVYFFIYFKYITEKEISCDSEMSRQGHICIIRPPSALTTGQNVFYDLCVMLPPPSAGPGAGFVFGSRTELLCSLEDWSHCWTSRSLRGSFPLLLWTPSLSWPGMKKQDSCEMLSNNTTFIAACALKREWNLNAYSVASLSPFSRAFSMQTYTNVKMNWLFSHFQQPEINRNTFRQLRRTKLFSLVRPSG